MGAYAHKTKSKRRIITLIEWAVFLGVDRQSVYKYLAAFKADGGAYDPRDIYSVLTFHRYLLVKKALTNTLLNGQITRTPPADKAPANEAQNS
jgi:hypothetical protein